MPEKCRQFGGEQEGLDRSRVRPPGLLFSVLLVEQIRAQRRRKERRRIVFVFTRATNKKKIARNLQKKNSASDDRREKLPSFPISGLRVRVIRSDGSLTCSCVNDARKSVPMTCPDDRSNYPFPDATRCAHQLLRSPFYRRNLHVNRFAANIWKARDENEPAVL